MTSKLPYLRRAVQALSFCFLLYLILQTAFPLELKIPVDLYLRLDPFIGIIAVLTQKSFILRMVPAFGVLLLVFVFGNFFCGWFCPMGATIDFFDRILFRENKKAKGFDDHPLRRLRYGVFFFSIITGLMAFQVMYLLDPISLITRTLVISFYPPTIYVFNQLSSPGSELSFSKSFHHVDHSSAIVQGQSLHLSLLRPCPRPRSGAEEVLVPLPLPSGDALFDLVAPPDL